MPNTQTTTSGDDKHWTRSDFENLQYIVGYDTSTNPSTPIYKSYPSTIYQKTTVVQDSDGNILNQSEYDNDIVTGFTNPNLHRRVDYNNNFIYNNLYIISDLLFLKYLL